MTTADPRPEAWQDIDEADAGVYATTYLDAAARHLGASRLRSHELLGVGPGSVVLDIGCGTGIALWEIAGIVGPGGCVVGIDLSEAMLAEAGARLEGVDASVELQLASATATEQPDDRFDAVRTERVLMHVPDLQAAITELARVTRPGGRIVMVEPDHRRLAVDSDDREFMLEFARGFGRAIPNLSAGLQARSEGVLAGLQVPVVEMVPFQFDSFGDFSSVFQLEAGREFLLADGMSQDRFDGFLAEQERRDREGRFLAVGAMYVVVAEKPGGSVDAS